MFVSRNTNNQNPKSNKIINRRDLIKYASGSLMATTSIGMVSAKPSKSKENKVKQLLKSVQESDNREAYYKTLSQREKELVQFGLSLKPNDLSSETTVSRNTDSSSRLTPQGTTTYTERNKVTVPNPFNQTILTYYHTLHWTVDLGANKITSANVEVSGTGFLFWQYDREVDPQYKTVRGDGCSSTRSGLFRECNEVEGVGFCTKELDTKITSNISGFPNGRASSSENVRQCGTNC